MFRWIHRAMKPFRFPRPGIDFRRARRDCVRIGTEYGGWWFEPNADLHGALVVSAGAGEDISFDVGIAAEYGAQVLIIDPTPRAVAHVTSVLERTGQSAEVPFEAGGKQPVAAYDLTNVKAGQIRLVSVALWNEDRQLMFHPPLNPSHVSHSVDNWRRESGGDAPAPIHVSGKRLSTLLNREDLAGLSILKLDIEGAEIEVLTDILHSGILPSQVLVEFDQLQKPTSSNKARVRYVLKALNDVGYRLLRREGFNYSFLHVKALP